jgi:Glutathione S-transferase, N-terminal domain
MLPRTRLSYTLMSQKPLLLYTARSPNGAKPSILLEELKAAYGLDYDYQALTLSKKEQKEEWYIRINPNGKSLFLFCFLLHNMLPIRYPRTHTCAR